MNIEELFNKTGDRIYGFLLLKLGSEKDAEDVLQEVFYRLTRYRLTARLVRDRDAYAFKIARNEAHRFLRRRLRDRQTLREAEGLAADPEKISPALAGPDGDLRVFVTEALAKIPEDQREVIVLKIFEGLTFEQIASACRLSVNTAASRYRYGLEKMRRLLEERYGP